MIENPALSPENRPGILRATGPDTLVFLQGQVTQDLRIPAGTSTYGLLLSVKGKILAEAYFLNLGPSGFLLVSPHRSAADLRAGLEANLIADEVELTELNDWKGISGLLPTPLLSPSPAAAAPAWVSLAGGHLFPGAAGFPAWVWVGPADTVLPEALPPASPLALDAARIALGRAAVPQDAGTGHLPQEVGLDVLGVSYTKGCYLGQEVMARLHAMGRPRRRLVRLAGQGPTPPLPSPVCSGGKTVGELTSAIAKSDGGWFGLATVNLLGLQPDALSVGDAPTLLFPADRP
jgi:tRNA-modifying protein YgfZ